MTVEAGSRWYVFGHHWEVIEEGERDGQPAVLVRCLTGQNPKKPWGYISLRALERHGRPSEGTLRREKNGNHNGRQKAAPKGGAVSDAATQQEKDKAKPEGEAAKTPAAQAAEKDAAAAEQPSKDELLATMEQNQKGYDAYCKLRGEIKAASKQADKDALAKKQEKHKAAFKAWKKAYNGLLKLGISLRDIKAEQKKAAETDKPKAASKAKS